MAHPSRDSRLQDRSRDSRQRQVHRGSEENERRYGADDTDYGRSVDGIGDYGGYSEEENSYRSEFSPASGRNYGHPDRHRDEQRDSIEERYGRPERSRFGSGRDDMSSMAYGGGQREPQRGDRTQDTRWSAERSGWDSEAYGRERSGSWEADRYPHESSDGRRYGGYGSSSGFSSGGYGRDYGRGWYNGGESGRDTRSAESQSHRGKGPKGYQRSDERLKEIVCERLSDDHAIDASEISIAVSGGTVTLTGTVENRRDKFAAEDLIAQMSGVKDVDNRLRVQSASSNSVNSSLGSGLDSSTSGERRPEATSTTSGLSSPAKK